MLLLLAVLKARDAAVQRAASDRSDRPRRTRYRRWQASSSTTHCCCSPEQRRLLCGPMSIGEATTPSLTRCASGSTTSAWCVSLHSRQRKCSKRHCQEGPITLFDLMAPLHPVVLFNGVADSHQWCECLRQVNVDAYAVTTNASAGDGSLPQLFDRTGDFAKLYGFQSGFLCLIRPDGHVGLVQLPPNRDRLQNYLTSMCERTQLERAFG